MAVERATWIFYPFQIYPEATEWNDVPGVYIFAGKNKNDKWVAYYIDQTQSFIETIPTHAKWEEAKKLGATHVHTLPVANEVHRDNIEQTLLQRFSPPLNT